MYTKAIVKKPSRNFADGITSAILGKPDNVKALEQHSGYVEALKKCGLEVITLEADEDYPDSTFIEDTAVLTEKCAIITRPGAASRQGEEMAIQEVLKNYYNSIEVLSGSGTLEGGDILRFEDHFYIGLSNRTNEEGAKQLINILERYGYTCSLVPLKYVLHLKTGITYLNRKNFIAAGEFIGHSIFSGNNIIEVDGQEAYAANCILLNDYVLMAKGFPNTRAALQRAGYEVLDLDMSEFQKMDGGLTCLSLRF